jgi:hypothetical protein
MTMQIRYNHSWPRRGFALLWDTETLGDLVRPSEVLSMRELFVLKNHWPEALPAANGDALVVAGLEGSLDVLNGADAQEWLAGDFRDLILSFQDHYQGQAGLILWLPSGHGRISMNGATEEYFWTHRDSGDGGLPIGRLLFSGAESEVERLMNTDEPGVDVDGKHWIGLYHPRIS